MQPIKFAIAGVGNVASALIQGLAHEVRVLRRPSPIIPVLGFDIHSSKVGLSLKDAIFVAPNCVKPLNENLEAFKGEVMRGHIEEKLSEELAAIIPVDLNQPTANISDSLRAVGAEVLVITLPTGLQATAEIYARAAIEAGLAVVNGMPARIAKLPKIVDKAKEMKVAVIGDDIKSQVGATIIHRALMDVFRTREAVVDRTLQLDWGGDADFLNLVRGGRYQNGKLEAKTQAVIWNHPQAEAYISASDYVPFLENTKEAYARVEGTIFGGAKVRVDLFMSVEDAFNSAGVIKQAVECAGIATRCGVGGCLEAASAWFCKHPPIQMTDDEALRKYREFMAVHRAKL